MHPSTFHPPSSQNVETDPNSLFEEAPIPYHEIDCDGILRRVNRAERELLGYEASEMIGRPIWDFVAREEQGDSQLAIARKIRTDIPGRATRRSYVARDGRNIPIEIFDRILHDSRGHVSGIRSAIIDISERHAAETALLENKRWMEATLSSLSEAVVAVDSLGSIKFLNGAAESMIGLTSSLVVGNEAAALIHIAALSFGAHQDKSFADVINAGLFETWTARGLLQSNLSPALIPVEVSSSPIIIEDGTVLGTIFVIRRMPHSA